MRVSDLRARDFGEVLTPTWVAEDMLSAVSSGVLNDPSRPALDLCAGPGIFITLIAQRRLQALGSNPNRESILNVFQNLYAIELLDDNVVASKATLLELATSTASNLSAEELRVLTQDVKQAIDTNIMQGDALTSSPLPTLDWGLVISNPPYQKNISGSTQDTRLRNHSKATPIYNKFFDYARALNPENLVFIMPSKWFTGGWGLDAWRASVLNDKRIHRLVDYRDSNFLFPGTEVNGGVCWVAWRRGTITPKVHITRYDRDGKQVEDSKRPLREPGADFFIRDSTAFSILRKVRSLQLREGERFSDLILSTTPFGIPSNFTGYSTTPSTTNSVTLFYIKEKQFWIPRSQVTRGVEVIDQWKLFLPLSHNQHSKQKVGTPHVFPPGSVCSHSYLAVKGFRTEEEAKSAASYVRTKFFRFLAGQLKISPIATRNVYRLIPAQAWDKVWTDEMLYDTYGFSEQERQYIEATISPM